MNHQWNMEIDSADSSIKLIPHGSDDLHPKFVIFQLCNAPAAYVAAPKERQLCVGGRGSIVLGMVSNSLKEGRLRIDEWLHISIGHLVKKNLNWAH
jgi:hypothetical protein